MNKGYAEVVKKVQAVREVLRGPFSLVNDEAGEESLRQAYFAGRLEFIGWVPNSDREKDAVAKVRAETKDAPSEWNATTAKQRAEGYRQQALAFQAPSRNVVSVGLFFHQESQNAIGVRYARVIARTEFARGQLYLEGQALGQPC